MKACSPSAEYTLEASGSQFLEVREGVSGIGSFKGKGNVGLRYERMMAG